jgi:hypothetical protein
MEGPAATGDFGSPQPKARLAGALWLVTIAAGLFAELGARSAVFVRGDAGATAARIAASEPLYRLGFAADLVGTAAYLGVSLLLYDLLSPVSRSAARAAAAFGIAGSIILAADLVLMYAPLVLIGSGYDALALPALRLHAAGYNISLVFFSVQVGLLGWLVLRSTFLPRILGILLLLEAACNFAHCFGTFLKLGFIERFDSYVLLPGLPAEGGMTLWLLIVGVNAAKWREQPRR